MAEDDKDPDDPIKNNKDAVDQLNFDAIDWHRPASESDIQYLIDHAPFLQMIDTSASPNIESVKIIKGVSGWNIHYYGDAMSSSPGVLLFGGGDFRFRYADPKKNQYEDEGGDDGGTIINPGKGTFRNQAFMTACEMIDLAKQNGWEGIRLIDGHPLMQWAAWVHASDVDLPLAGYSPDQVAEKKYDRLKRSRTELEMLTGFKPKFR